MIGATVIDTAITPQRRGKIVSVEPETMTVTVSWRPGSITLLRVADIRAGRYQVQL